MSFQFNPNTHRFIEVKEATRFERIKRTRVPFWVMLLITFVPPLIFGAVMFTGCSEDVKTVEYYKEHTDERKAKIGECRNNPGGMKGDPNCHNAFVAHSQALDQRTDKSGGKTIDDFLPTYTKQ